MAADVMALPAPVVLIAAGAPVPVTVSLNWSAAAKRPEAAIAFCKLSNGAFPALVNLQVICAAGKTLAAGMAINWPVNVPKLAGLPVTAELASEQLAPEIVKKELAPSEICTIEFRVLTVVVGGTTGAGVPAVVVVIGAGAAARFETAKLNAPPGAPVVIF